MINQRTQGNDYEKIASKYLEEQGLEILEYNYFSRMGEIDIIARENEYLVFVEVKYRKNNKKGSALEAVTYNKMKKICRACDYYLLTHGYSDAVSVRFDVVAIEEGHLKYVPNAFEYIPIR